MIESMRALFEAEANRPATPHMVYGGCRHCRKYWMCPDPGMLKCPECGERSTLGEALGASDWDDIKI